MYHKISASLANSPPSERDSRKDEAVVFIFIFATAGLLIWAALKPWVEKWVEVSFPLALRDVLVRLFGLLEGSGVKRLGTFINSANFYIFLDWGTEGS